MTYDRRLADQQFKSFTARKCMKAKTHEKIKPRQERMVDIRNVTDQSSVLNPILGPKTF